MVEDDEGNIRGAMNILIRKVPFLNYTLMQASRAPVCDPHDEEAFRALIDCAKQLAKKYKSYALFLEPDVEREDRSFEELVIKLGFRLKSQSKNFEGINPRFVYRLDIAGKTEEELMQSFHQKTRYNIRLSSRKGVEVKIGTREDLPRFYKIMVETGVRDHFVFRSLEYFERMYDSMAPEHLRLYLAVYEGKIIAGTIPLCTVKNAGTCMVQAVMNTGMSCLPTCFSGKLSDGLTKVAVTCMTSEVSPEIWMRKIRFMACIDSRRALTVSW
jgi:predicted N-acyltransferase